MCHSHNAAMETDMWITITFLLISGLEKSISQQIKSNYFQMHFNEQDDNVSKVDRIPHRSKRAVDRDEVNAGLSEAQGNETVDAHNYLRRQEPAANMEYMMWNEVLSDTSRKTAASCSYSPGDVIQMDATLSAAQNMIILNNHSNDINLTRIIMTWYDESYNISTGRCRQEQDCGAHVQLVWASNSEVGCGYNMCDMVHDTSTNETITNAALFVCTYRPGALVISNVSSPYTVGAACSRCNDGFDWCDSLQPRGLCRRDCNAETEECVRNSARLEVTAEPASSTQQESLNNIGTSFSTSLTSSRLPSADVTSVSTPLKQEWLNNTRGQSTDFGRTTSIHKTPTTSSIPVRDVSMTTGISKLSTVSVDITDMFEQTTPNTSEQTVRKTTVDDELEPGSNETPYNGTTMDIAMVQGNTTTDATLTSTDSVTFKIPATGGIRDKDTTPSLTGSTSKAFNSYFPSDTAAHSTLTVSESARAMTSTTASSTTMTNMTQSINMPTAISSIPNITSTMSETSTEQLVTTERTLTSTRSAVSGRIMTTSQTESPLDTATQPVNVTILPQTTTQPVNTSPLSYTTVDSTTLINSTTSPPINAITLSQNTTTQPVNTATFPQTITTQPLNSTTLSYNTTTQHVDPSTLIINTTTPQVNATTVPQNTTTQKPVNISTLQTSTITQPVNTTILRQNTTTQLVNVTTVQYSTTTQTINNTALPYSTTTQPVNATTFRQNTTTQLVSNTTVQRSTTTQYYTTKPPENDTALPSSTTTQPITTSKRPNYTTKQFYNTTTRSVPNSTKIITNTTTMSLHNTTALHNVTSTQSYNTTTPPHKGTTPLYNFTTLPHRTSTLSQRTNTQSKSTATLPYNTTQVPHNATTKSFLTTIFLYNTTTMSYGNTTLPHITTKLSYSTTTTSYNTVTLPYNTTSSPEKRTSITTSANTQLHNVTSVKTTRSTMTTMIPVASSTGTYDTSTKVTELPPDSANITTSYVWIIVIIVVSVNSLLLLTIVIVLTVVIRRRYYSHKLYNVMQSRGTRPVTLQPEPKAFHFELTGSVSGV